MYDLHFLQIFIILFILTFEARRLIKIIRRPELSNGTNDIVFSRYNQQFLLSNFFFFLQDRCIFYNSLSGCTLMSTTRGYSADADSMKTVGNRLPHHWSVSCRSSKEKRLKGKQTRNQELHVGIRYSNRSANHK